MSFALIKKISQNKKAALVVSALVATNFVLSYWAAKGMETPLFVCLVLGSFLFYLRILEVKKSLLLGAKNYIVKPLDRRKVLERIFDVLTK